MKGLHIERIETPDGEWWRLVFQVEDPVWVLTTLGNVRVAGNHAITSQPKPTSSGSWAAR